VEISDQATYWNPLPGDEGHTSNPWIQRTDDAGQFQWEKLEVGTYRLELECEGYSRRYSTLVIQDELQTIEMQRILRVVGTVSDAKTGVPISEYNLNRIDGPARLMKQQYVSKRTTLYENGAFELTYVEDRVPLWVLIGTPNHYSEKFELVSEDGSSAEGHLALVSGERLTGSVLSATSTPVVGAQVGVSNLFEGTIVADGVMESPDTVTGADGAFELWPSKPPFTLSIVHESGFAIVSDTDYVQGGIIQLQPWLQMTGEIQEGFLPTVGAKVSITHQSGGEGPPQAGWTSFTKSDGNGKFAFDHTFPGKWDLARWVPAGPLTSRPAYRRDITIDLRNNTDVRLGGGGKSVVGQVKLPFDVLPNVSEGYSYCIATLIKNEIPYPDDIVTSINAVKKRWEYEWSQTPEGRRFKKYQYLHTFAGSVKADGSFCFDNVRPGNYDLEVVIHHKDSGMRHVGEKLLGRATAQFSVEEQGDRAAAVALDLNELMFVSAE